jgi:exosortase E/protease (VPEID-CTERM system)
VAIPNSHSTRILAEINKSQPGPLSFQPAFLSRLLPRFLLGRFYLLAILLALDCVLVASVPHAGSLLGPLAPSGIVAFALFLGLGYPRLKTRRQPLPFQTGIFLTHVVCIAALVLGNLVALRGSASWSHPWSDPRLNSLPMLLLSGAVLVAAVSMLALACIPLSAWVGIARQTSPAGQYAVLGGVVAWLLRSPLQSLWLSPSAANVNGLQVVTFHSVEAVLKLFRPDILVNPGQFIIGTPRFSVIVGSACSGFEGLGLVLVFTIVWLWFFRKETRFPQAFLLIPLALVCAFSLNVLRITALILIGDAGAPDVAFVGFHSQAGWIAFTLVALGFSMATQKLAWVRKGDGGTLASSEFTLRAIAQPESPATAAYLIPFLAILAASFISKSASGYFEWLYPLRFVAAAAAIWIFRREYRRLNWRFGWAAPLTGVAVFLIWIAPEGWAHGAANSFAANSLGSLLAALSPVARWSWIAVRVSAAVITVPIAEELAFRGYLARRIMGREFDEIPLSRLSLVAIALSSIVFGLMHGQNWLLGILAGVAYAFLLRSKGRIGDAVVAHAVSNLLLAVWILARGDWGLW